VHTGQLLTMFVSYESLLARQGTDVFYAVFPEWNFTRARVINASVIHPTTSTRQLFGTASSMLHNPSLNLV
jgi:hypothetical protein